MADSGLAERCHSASHPDLNHPIRENFTESSYPRRPKSPNQRKPLRIILSMEIRITQSEKASLNQPIRGDLNHPIRDLASLFHQRGLTVTHLPVDHGSRDCDPYRRDLNVSKPAQTYSIPSCNSSISLILRPPDGV